MRCFLIHFQKMFQGCNVQISICLQLFKQVHLFPEPHFPPCVGSYAILGKGTAALKHCWQVLVSYSYTCMLPRTFPYDFWNAPYLTEGEWGCYRVICIHRNEAWMTAQNPEVVEKMIPPQVQISHLLMSFCEIIYSSYAPFQKKLADLTRIG